MSSCPQSPSSASSKTIRERTLIKLIIIDSTQRNKVKQFVTLIFLFYTNLAKIYPQVPILTLLGIPEKFMALSTSLWSLQLFLGPWLGEKSLRNLEN